MYSGIRLIVYESVVTLNSGASGHGWLVSAAPPVLCRFSSTTTRLAVLRQVGGRDEPVVPATDDDGVVVVRHRWLLSAPRAQASLDRRVSGP